MQTLCIFYELPGPIPIMGSPHRTRVQTFGSMRCPWRKAQPVLEGSRRSPYRCTRTQLSRTKGSNEQRSAAPGHPSWSPKGQIIHQPGSAIPIQYQYQANARHRRVMPSQNRVSVTRILSQRRVPRPTRAWAQTGPAGPRQ
jgi:hypothetical protein